MRFRRLAWFLPIPAPAVLMATAYRPVAPSVFHDPPWLILIGNTLAVAVVSCGWGAAGKARGPGTAPD